MKLINDVIKEFEAGIEAQRRELGDEGSLLEKVKIQILGQMSLLMNPEVNSRIPLLGTQDVDALLKGRWGQTKIFRDVLNSKGLTFDELSSEVWLPKEAEFIEYYDSPFVNVSYLDPISALTSKAIKAAEKNKSLISDALKIYGDKLATKITSYGGDVSFFAVRKKLKL